MPMINFIICRLRLAELRDELKDLDNLISQIYRNNSEKECEKLLVELATLLSCFQVLRKTLEVSQAKANEPNFTWEEFFEICDQKYQQIKFKRCKRRYFPLNH